MIPHASIRAKKLAPRLARFNVLLHLIQAQDGMGLDVLNAKAVDAYREAVGAECEVTYFGANKCARMALDLSQMTDEGWLSRSRVGVRGMAGMGFPRWVWSYDLTDAGKKALQEAADHRVPVCRLGVAGEGSKV